MVLTCVPRVVRPQHIHTGLVQLRGHVPDGVEAAGHGAEEVELVAVVDADVCGGAGGVGAGR